MFDNIVELMINAEKELVNDNIRIINDSVMSAR